MKTVRIVEKIWPPIKNSGRLLGIFKYVTICNGGDSKQVPFSNLTQSEESFAGAVTDHGDNIREL